MPVTPDNMTVDAKLQHHAVVIDRTAADNIVQSGGGLYHPNRDIVVVKAFHEVIVQHVSASGVYLIGKYTPAGVATDIQFYMPAIAIATSVAGGVFTEITLANNLIAKGEVLRVTHTSNAGAGTTAFHLFYYYKQNQSNTQELL